MRFTRPLLGVTAGALATLALAAPGAFAAPGSHGGPAAASGGAVFVQTDNVAGNAVVAYKRSAAGRLTQAGTYKTGGNGGALEGAKVDFTASQGSLALDAEAGLRRLEAEHGALPATVEVITARGRHIYFKWPHETVRNSASKIGAHIDVRGDGGYVLCPPSTHPNGRRYCWSVDSADSIADAPHWLLAKQNGVAVSPTSSPEWRALIGGVDEGARDCSLTRLAGHLLRHRVDPFVTLGLLQSWNATNCNPPLPAADVERIVNSIAGKELRRRRNG